MRKIPDTFVSAEPWDKMLWSWKLEGKGWVEIVAKWQELTDDPRRFDKEETTAEYAYQVRTLKEKLMVRWRLLLQSFAASGTLAVSTATLCHLLHSM